MLVPRTRLLAVIALAVLPAAALAGTLPALRPAGVALIAIFVLVVAIDALRARRQLAGIGVGLPELIRLQKDRPGSLAVRLRNDSQRARPLRLGFAFPREIAVDDDIRLTALPAGAALSQLDWTCTPNKRGQYSLDRAYLETPSPLGFWAARASQPVRSELRVYPNLFDERKSVAALFLRRGALGTQAHRQTGQGREFEKLREYVHGDSIDDIHWKASAKRGHPVTKVFQIERTQEVYVIVDASRLSGREVSGSRFQVPHERARTARGADAETRNQKPETTVLERFVTASLILGLAAEQQGDQFGLITFSDKVLSFVRAKNGQAHYDACRDRLYTLHPQSVSPDFDELCSFIRLKLRKRALLIFLTSLDDPMLAESFVKSIQLVCRQHLVLVDMLKPASADPLFHEPGEVAALDDLYHRLGGHLQWHQLRELQKVLQRRGVRLAQLDPAKLPAQLVAQHADVRARQLV